LIGWGRGEESALIWNAARMDVGRCVWPTMVSGIPLTLIVGIRGRIRGRRIMTGGSLCVRSVLWAPLTRGTDVRRKHGTWPIGHGGLGLNFCQLFTVATARFIKECCWTSRGRNEPTNSRVRECQERIEEINDVSNIDLSPGLCLK
jgi:hypothetical protein